LAKLIYAFNQSLDGYVDHEKFPPCAALFRHFLRTKLVKSTQGRSVTPASRPRAISTCSLWTRAGTGGGLTNRGSPRWLQGSSPEADTAGPLHPRLHPYGCKGIDCNL